MQVKKRRVNSDTGASQHVDHFSLLPDSLLFLILSLLPLPDAVRTSVLSQRWRFLWIHRYPFEVCDSFFLHERRRIRTQRCIEFALKWASNYGSSIVPSFSISLSNPWPYILDLNYLLGFASSHRARSLYLHFKCPFNLPWWGYVHKGLQKLTMVSLTLTNPQLHYLLLYSTSLGHITLSKCDGGEEYEIVSNSLEEVVVERCRKVKKMSLNVPKLRCFVYSGRLIDLKVEGELENLEMAKVKFGMEKRVGVGSGDKVALLLGKLCSARVLHVCSFLTQAIGGTTVDLANHLEKARVQDLIIDTEFHPVESNGIFCLLNAFFSLCGLRFDVAPQHIRQGCNGDCYHSMFWKNTTPTRRKGRKLEQVEINRFTGERGEMFTLSYILDFYGQALHTLVLRINNASENDVYGQVQRYHEVALMVQHQVCKNGRRVFIEDMP